MSAPVLFDLPGPKARARIRVGTAIGTLVVLAVIAFVLVRLAGNGQLDPQRWSVLFDPASGVPQALGQALMQAKQAIGKTITQASGLALLGCESPSGELKPIAEHYELGRRSCAGSGGRLRRSVR